MDIDEYVMDISNNEGLVTGFNEIDVDLEIDQSFEGSNTEIYDCTVCCNPNKLQYTVTNGSIMNVLVSDGNE